MMDFFLLGQECAFGSYDHIRLFSYQPRKGMFDEAPMKEIKNMYTVTAMAWRSGRNHRQRDVRHLQILIPHV
jgi:hypothetical protein